MSLACLYTHRPAAQSTVRYSVSSDFASSALSFLPFTHFICVQTGTQSSSYLLLSNVNEPASQIIMRLIIHVISLLTLQLVPLYIQSSEISSITVTEKVSPKWWKTTAIPGTKLINEEHYTPLLCVFSMQDIIKCLHATVIEFYFFNWILKKKRKNIATLCINPYYIKFLQFLVGVN